MDARVDILFYHALVTVITTSHQCCGFKRCSGPTSIKAKSGLPELSSLKATGPERNHFQTQFLAEFT